jgi:hypothetical protein
MSVSDQLNAIITLLQESVEDANKVDSGKAGAPGTRLRKAAQEAKKSLDSIRKGVLAARG